ncbi:hypothetical protein [Mesorhizobium silamurunense]|uniref:hypothetical protein n=1 Tax=Mesorhizobium silamurunense TaxID=499528 RepID=UPI00177E1F55|nr:hypothetical protein [Mesorhizobium silamurunense]
MEAHIRPGGVDVAYLVDDHLSRVVRKQKCQVHYNRHPALWEVFPSNQALTVR